MSRTLVAAASFVALAMGVALAAPAAEEDLAARCEKVKWALVVPDDGVVLDPLPEGLKAIRDELKARGPSAMDAIEPALPRSLHLRRVAPSVLKEWPCDRSRRLLVELARDPDEDVAAWAAFGLGAVGGAEVIPALVAAAGDGRARVRHDALNALDGAGASNRGLDAAVAALGARESFVRHSAAEALSHADHRIEYAIPALERAAAKESEDGARGAMETALRVLRARLGR